MISAYQFSDENVHFLLKIIIIYLYLGLYCNIALTKAIFLHVFYENAMLCLLRCKSITTRETVKIAVTLRTGVLEDFIHCENAARLCISYGDLYSFEAALHLRRRRFSMLGASDLL